jgi:hypothetical protein
MPHTHTAQPRTHLFLLERFSRFLVHGSNNLAPLVLGGINLNWEEHCKNRRVLSIIR